MAAWVASAFQDKRHGVACLGEWRVWALGLLLPGIRQEYRSTMRAAPCRRAPVYSTALVRFSGTSTARCMGTLVLNLCGEHHTLQCRALATSAGGSASTRSWWN
ncbi:hypothetical protein SEVIR_2G316901v4 [Setaria viridis]